MPSSRVAVVRSMGKRTFPFKCPVANASALARNSGARVAKKRHRQGLTVIWCRGQCLLSKRAIPAEAPPRRRITTNSGRAICTSPGHRGDALCCGCPSWCPSISLQRRVSMELPPLSLYRREKAASLAPTRSTIEFRYWPRNKSVVAGDFSYACRPAMFYGFFSSFFPNTVGTVNLIHIHSSAHPIPRLKR